MKEIGVVVWRPKPGWGCSVSVFDRWEVVEPDQLPDLIREIGNFCTITLYDLDNELDDFCFEIENEYRGCPEPGGEEDDEDGIAVTFKVK